VIILSKKVFFFYSVRTVNNPFSQQIANDSYLYSNTLRIFKYSRKEIEKFL